MAGSTKQWLLDHKDYPHDYCLIWPFAREARTGRGHATVDGFSDWAHRIMCDMAHGRAPTEKHQVAHSCGNGDQGCVNPRHLSWKTNSENQIERYRVHGRRNPNANGARSMFTPEQIEEIRSKYGEFTQVKLAEMYGCSLGTIQYYLKYREQRGHAGTTVNHWAPEEDEALRAANINGRTWKQISEIVGRAEGACVSRAARLGIKSTWVNPYKKAS